MNQKEMGMSKIFKATKEREKLLGATSLVTLSIFLSVSISAQNVYAQSPSDGAYDDDEIVVTAQ